MRSNLEIWVVAVAHATGGWPVKGRAKVWAELTEVLFN